MQTSIEYENQQNLYKVAQTSDNTIVFIQIITLFTLLIIEYIIKIVKQSQSMLKIRKQFKLTPKLKLQSQKKSISPIQNENSESSHDKKDQSGYRRLHKNACRTKVCDFLQYKSQKLNKIKNPSLWLISKTYLKKLQHFKNTIQTESKDEAELKSKDRKISWSEQAEYVYFNHRKSSATISQSQRHTFSLNG